MHYFMRTRLFSNAASACDAPCERYAATGNDFMTSYLNSLQTQSQRLAYICFARPTMVNLETHAEASIRDHHELIACLKQTDEPVLWN